MCGRYSLFDLNDLAHRFRIDQPIPQMAPNYNVAPGQTMPVVTRNSPNQIQLMRWGLIPFWAKEDRVGYKTINAKAETVLEKPTFHKPARRQRCLVPANSFYEWHRRGSGSIPHNIRSKTNELMAFAGLYDEWQSTAGQSILSYTIVTTTTNSSMAWLHERMPLILTRPDEDLWLDGSTSMDEIRRILAQPVSEDLEMYPISSQVNQVRNNYPELQERVEPSLSRYMDHLKQLELMEVEPAPDHESASD